MNIVNIINILSEHLSNTLEYLSMGGYVIFPLIGIAVWMWYLIVKKLIIVYSASGIRLKNKDKSENGVVRMIKAEFKNKQSLKPETDKKLLHSIVMKYQNELEAHIQTIFVLASVAPLLGLLGTVAGMISTFEAMSDFGTGNACALAAGISEALITTQIGLTAAVPGLFMGHFIRRRAHNIQMRLERLYLNKIK
ncbi:biopolymer transport protein ExbB [Candidatus Magnetomoraceae bacterium gMMP-1]